MTTIFENANLNAEEYRTLLRNDKISRNGSILELAYEGHPYDEAHFGKFQLSFRIYLKTTDAQSNETYVDLDVRVFLTADRQDRLNAAGRIL